MAIYQQTLDMLGLKKDQRIDYILGWKSRGVSISELKPLYAAFLNSIKLARYRMGIKFDKDLLAVKQNYTTKIANGYIVYDLDAWPRILLTISSLKIAYLTQLIY